LFSPVTDPPPALTYPETKQEPQPQTSNISTPLNHRVTQSQTGSLKPKTFPGFQLYATTKHPLQSFFASSLPHEPTTYHQAASNP
jgi:hypothetical protein